MLAILIFHSSLNIQDILKSLMEKKECEMELLPHGKIIA